MGLKRRNDLHCLWPDLWIVSAPWEYVHLTGPCTNLKRTINLSVLVFGSLACPSVFTDVFFSLDGAGKTLAPTKTLHWSQQNCFKWEASSNHLQRVIVKMQWHRQLFCTEKPLLNCVRTPMTPQAMTLHWRRLEIGSSSQQFIKIYNVDLNIAQRAQQCQTVRGIINHNKKPFRTMSS